MKMVLIVLNNCKSIVFCFLIFFNAFFSFRNETFSKSSSQTVKSDIISSDFDLSLNTEGKYGKLFTRFFFIEIFRFCFF